MKRWRTIAGGRRRREEVAQILISSVSLKRQIMACDHKSSGAVCENASGN